MNYFDLNIDKILENWTPAHAVRELIANALDEHVLTGTKEPEIRRFPDYWSIRDWGRGLKYQDLTQKESAEKLEHPDVIGKFGIGLKDALATFDRHGIRIEICSRYGDISLERTSKHSFEDLVTLHAVVRSASSPDFIGTECRIYGLEDRWMDEARKMFVKFSSSRLIEKTGVGELYERLPHAGVIYINGMRVAEEENFMFSYNITSINVAIKKALNRERQNLGRSAYTERVKSVLLSCGTPEVHDALVDALNEVVLGNDPDELTWLDVRQHAIRIISARESVMVVTPQEIQNHPSLIDSARSSGYTILPMPESTVDKVRGVSDIKGDQVTDIYRFSEEMRNSFEFKWVEPAELSPTERVVWDKVSEIVGLIGRPANVKRIRISETMDEGFGAACTVGLWRSSEGEIIVRRSELKSLESFAGTILHEVVHATSGMPDVNRTFELELTSVIGRLAARLVR